MEKRDMKELKKIANEIKPQFNIGKGGISDTFVESIDKYIEAHEIVKIKSLISIDKSDVEVAAKEVAEKTNSEIVEKKGFTFVLFRAKK